MGESTANKSRRFWTTVNLTGATILLGSCVFNSLNNLPEKPVALPRAEAVRICLEHAKDHNHMFQSAEVTRYETFSDGGSVVELAIHHQGKRLGKIVDRVGPYWCGIDSTGSVGPYENERYPG